MIDALFGSKTRVKLLHLFLSNPSKSFYVREITRLIDEQINSVRRELANMLDVGIVVSETVENKLYYRVNQRYKYYVPFRAIFSNDPTNLIVASKAGSTSTVLDEIKKLKGASSVIIAGVLVEGSASPIDLLVAGDFSKTKLAKLVTELEQTEGREINYATMSDDEIYYRLSIRDRFISEVLDTKHTVLVDKKSVIPSPKG